MIAWIALIVAVLALIAVAIHAFIAEAPYGRAHEQNPINERLIAMFPSLHPATAITAAVITADA